MIGSAFRLLETEGALSLANYPYDESQCQPPSDAQQSRADDFRISGWVYLRPDLSRARDEKQARLNAVRQELAFGHPVVIGVDVTTTFFEGKGVWTGNGSETCGNEPCGGHAVTLTGYDDRERRFKFVNSWGTRWGDSGFGWMSYDAYLNQVDEAYAMRVPDEPEPPEPLPTPTPEDFGSDLPGIDCGGLIIERKGRRFDITGFAGSQADIDKLRRAVPARRRRFQRRTAPLAAVRDADDVTRRLGDTRKPQVMFSKADMRPANRSSLTSPYDYQAICMSPMSSPMAMLSIWCSRARRR